MHPDHNQAPRLYLSVEPQLAPQLQPPARRPRRTRHRRWPRLLAIGGIGAVLLATSLAAMFALRGTGTAGAAGSLLDDVLQAAGFGLDEIVLVGHRNTPDSAIFAALDLENARSLASIDMGGVRRRLEQLPWIAGAELSRVYPGRLEVRVRERKPFAVWQTDGREVVIDESGRTLGEIHRSTGLGLPVVTGAGAPAEAQALMSALARQPEIARRLEKAERVGERRWTLHLAGNVNLMLPADREAQSLAEAAADARLAKLMAAGGAIIDLRVPGRIAVRPWDAEAAPRSPPAGT